MAFYFDAPCDKCGETMSLLAGRERACVMTPKCLGKHISPKAPKPAPKSKAPTKKKTPK